MAKPSTSLLKRRLDIAEIVRKNGEIKVDDLAEMLAVSGVTIRNDLNYLEQQGYLKRSFGGAIYTSQAGTPIALAQEAPVVTDKALETEMARQIAFDYFAAAPEYAAEQHSFAIQELLRQRHMRQVI